MQIGCDDPTAAYILNRVVGIFGGFVESETKRFAQATKKTGSGKNEKRESPTQPEIVAFRQALISGKRYTGKRKRTRSERRKRAGIPTAPGGGRQIVQEPGGGYRVE